jgi:sporulation protein YlmC with PRC-barrel domain
MKKVALKARWLAAGVAAALVIAACGPADNDLTPDGLGTEPVGLTAQPTEALNTPMGTEPLATEPLATEPVETEVVETEVNPTEPLATTAPTEGAMTPDVTAEATTDTNATLEPSEEGQPNLLLSTELVGSQIVDMNAEEIGDVMEVLVDDAGMVQYVVFDASAFLASDVDAATPDPNATANPDVINEGVVAVPLTDFEVNTTMDTEGEINEAHVLVYQGTAADLETMAGFDVLVLDQDSFVIDTTDTTLDANFNGLIRVSEFSDWNLVNAADEDLGEVEDLVIDLSQQMVAFGIVDFGGFLGIGEQSTAVPWTLFIIEQDADANTQFQLDVTQETLENAPVVDLGAWPRWMDRVDTNPDWNMNWETDAQVFWEAAAN